MATYYTTKRVAVILANDQLDSGGEGSIYKIIEPANYRSLCAKIYHQTERNKAKEDKIKFLVSKSPTYQNNGKFRLCWPTKILLDISGKFVGFLMPLAFIDSIQLYQLVTTKINKNLNQNWHTKYNRNTESGIENRLKLCVNIAIAIHAIHTTKQFVLVDFKPQNILITNDAKVSIIDLDSIQITFGTHLFPAKVATAEYAPKESEYLSPVTSIISETWDRFSLAVVFYELLFGLHPYTATASGQYAEASTIDEKIRKNLFVHGSKKNYLQVIPNAHNKYYNLPSPLRELFDRAFEEGSQIPTKRPSAEEWGKIISIELSNVINLNYIRSLSNEAASTKHSSSTKQAPSILINNTPKAITPVNNTLKINSQKKRSWFRARTIFILILALLVILSIYQNTSVHKPTITTSDSLSGSNQNVQSESIPSQLTISKIKNNKTQTAITFVYNNGNSGWVNIRPETVLIIEKKKYPLLSVSPNMAIYPNKHKFSSNNQIFEFTLYFQSIGDALYFDMIECNEPGKNCFNFHNVYVKRPYEASWAYSVGNKIQPTVGTAMFWSRIKDGGKFTVTLGNRNSRQITVYQSDQFEPNCGKYGFATFELKPGKYNYKVESEVIDTLGTTWIWTGQINVLAGQCSKQELIE